MQNTNLYGVQNKFTLIDESIIRGCKLGHQNRCCALYCVTFKIRVLLSSVLEDSREFVFVLLLMNLTTKSISCIKVACFACFLLFDSRLEISLAVVW